MEARPAGGALCGSEDMDGIEDGMCGSEVIDGRRGLGRAEWTAWIAFFTLCPAAPMVPLPKKCARLSCGAKEARGVITWR